MQKAGRNIEGKEVELAKVTARIDSLGTELRNSEQKRAEIIGLLSELRKQQDKLSEGLAVLYKSQQKESLDWALAETEQLIVIAIHNLTLQYDAETALAALQSADDRLRSLGDPEVVAIRKQLAADMNALRSVKPVDITGLSLYLIDLVNRVDKLPLRNQPIRPAQEQTDVKLPEAQPMWKKLLTEVWNELKSLVVITRTGNDARALLLPEEKYFLYQNLRLQLESARLAVLQRDTENFHASVEIVIDWIGEYFNETDAGLNNIVESLQEMKTLELRPALPDISSSLETLRAYIKDRSMEVLPDNGDSGS